MKKNLDERELLDFYERHIFEDKQDNLSEIYRRLTISEETMKIEKKLRHKMRVCYGISCISFLFALLIFGGYRYLLTSSLTQEYALSTSLFPRLIHNIQTPEAIFTIILVIISAIVIGAFFLAAGLVFYIKIKNKKF